MPFNSVIIVLGAINDAQGNLSALATARVDRAYTLLTTHPDCGVMLTGGYGAHFNTADEPHAHYLRTYLLERRLDPERIVALIPSRHTVEDATLSRAVVAEHGFAKATIVTSQFHLRRARLIFQQVFGPGYALSFVGAAAPVGLRERVGLYRHEFRRTAELKRSGLTYPDPAADLDAK